MAAAYRALAPVAAACACLTALAAASAASADDYQRRIVSRDRATARAAVLKASDFGVPMKGGLTKSDNANDEARCTSYDPKLSDLVLTGEADSEFETAGLSVSSNVTMLQSVAMVRTDWKRSILPQMLTCLGSLVSKELGSDGKVVSVKRMSFPRVGERTFALRMLMDVASGSTRVQTFTDVVLFAAGRAEGFLMVSAPTALTKTIRPFERGLAEAMAGRLVQVA